MHKEEIIELWKSVGWHSTEDYHNDLIIDAKMPNEIIGDSLDPSKVNPKEFWKAADKHFFTDPVANHNNNPSTTLDIKKANYQNHLIPLFLGLYGGMEFAILNSNRKFEFTRIAEIGYGYGSFEEHFIDKRQSRDVHYYEGYDIIPRKPNVTELGDDGTFTEQQLEINKERFQIYYSCNVFQHLSFFQIKKYLNQIYEMLPFGGYFVFTYVRKPEAGYTYHYGQKIEIVDILDFKKILVDIGYEICYIYQQAINSSESLVPIGFVIKK